MSNPGANTASKGSGAAAAGEVYAGACFLAAAGSAVLCDRLTAVLLPLTTLLFYVVCRYARRYLQGDPGQARFTAWLCVTGSCVCGLILAQNLLLLALAWSATSLGLNQLLEFYRERPGALLAARKKFLISRLGDASLVGALASTWRSFHTWDFRQILAAADQLRAAGPEHLPTSVSAVCVLLTVAALLKSAQFPFHSWLPDTMETPTPVSALMHAGIINAGGILVIKLSPLISLSHGAMLILTLFGAFTALFASVIMWTQTSVKRCLAFSTVGQMGFMMLECGLGAFHLALLHLVAHSFYKAHAFLSSGSVVSARPRPQSNPLSATAVLAGLCWSGAITLAASTVFGTSLTDQPLLSGVFALALAQMLWTVWSPGTGVWLMVFGLLPGAFFATAYFSLERAASFIVRPVGWNHTGISLIVFAVFSLALAAQVQLTQLSRTRFGTRLYVHARNGFYFNTLANQLTLAIWPQEKTQ